MMLTSIIKEKIRNVLPNITEDDFEKIMLIIYEVRDSSYDEGFDIGRLNTGNCCGCKKGE